LALISIIPIGKQQTTIRCLDGQVQLAHSLLKGEDAYRWLLGMCGMDFSSSVRFRFGFEKTAGSVFFVDHS